MRGASVPSSIRESNLSPTFQNNLNISCSLSPPVPISLRPDSGQVRPAPALATTDLAAAALDPALGRVEPAVGARRQGSRGLGLFFSLSQELKTATLGPWPGLRRGQQRRVPQILVAARHHGHNGQILSAPFNPPLLAQSRSGAEQPRSGAPGGRRRGR